MDTAKEMGNAGVEAANDTFNQVKSKFDEGKEAARRYASKAKDVAGEYADKAGEYAKQAKDITEEKIVQNPFWSMLVAMGVGMTLGFVASAMFSRGGDYDE